MTLVQTELKSMKIWQPGNNFATQGPCPEGFHVPTKDERQALVAAMTTLGIDTSNGNCMKTYMKIPFAGRLYSSNIPSGQGTQGNYWASNAPTGFFSYGGAYALKFVSSYLETYEVDRSDGCSVRPFKNTPVALSTADIDYFDPDTQWPVIPGYETLYWNNDGIAGIYRDDTNGIITLSSDGETWITIADKNLGATTVYNNGDTLSQANCGNYFQWGNNYGFAWTGAVTTSSTMVDASTYGPGNYYSSSTFITGMGSPYDWSSVQNDNLWGGEDGNVPMLEEKEIKKIVIFPDGVTEKQIRPAGWQPGANTLLYLPLESDVVDQSGKTGRTFTTSSISYTTVGGVQSIHVGTSGGIKLTSPYPLQSDITKPLTVSVLIYRTGTGNGNVLDMASTGYQRLNCTIRSGNVGIAPGEFDGYTDNFYARLSTPQETNKRFLITYTISTTATKLYIDGELKQSGNGGRYPRSYWNRSRDNTQGILSDRSQGTYSNGLNGNARELILEEVEWTAQEVANYFTWIKSKLGF